MTTRPTIHLYHPDADLPPIPSREHDYDPGWDYDPVEPPEGSDLKSLLRAIHEIEQAMLPELGMKAAVLFFVERGGLGEAMARYVDGTSSCPMVALDIESIRDCDASSFEDQLRATLAHELGHAFVDARADRGMIDEIDEEMAVEDFASDWVNFRIVGTGLLEALIEDAEARDAPAA